MANRGDQDTRGHSCTSRPLKDLGSGPSTLAPSICSALQIMQRMLVNRLAHSVLRILSESKSVRWYYWCLILVNVKLMQEQSPCRQCMKVDRRTGPELQNAILSGCRTPAVGLVDVQLASGGRVRWAPALCLGASILRRIFDRGVCCPHLQAQKSAGSLQSP